MSSWVSGLNKLLSKTKTKQNKQNKQTKPKSKQTMRTLSRKTTNNVGRIGKTMYNPYSRYAGPLPSLAPAGRSVHLRSQLRMIQTVDEGSKAIICFSNYGDTAVSGYIYIKGPTSVPMKFVKLNFPRLPAPSIASGACTEMRPSKGTMMLRNLTPAIGRIKSCTVVATSQRPNVDELLHFDNSQTGTERNATFDMMFNQLYGRPEAVSYSFDRSEEICALPIDLTDYQSYKPPVVYSHAEVASAQQAVQAGSTNSIPMQNIYFLINAVQAAQDIEIDAFCSVRARYDMEAPISVMATPEHSFTMSEKRVIDYVLSQTKNGGVITSPPGQKT